MNLFFLPIQILLSLFLLFAISRAFLRFKERTIGLGQFLFWCGLWLLAIFTIFNPDATNYWAQLLGIGRGADVVLYASVIALFYLVFRLHVFIEDIHSEITHLVREVALFQEEKNRKIHRKRVSGKKAT
jgi:hypothetical protein